VLRLGDQGQEGQVVAGGVAGRQRREAGRPPREERRPGVRSQVRDRAERGGDRGLRLRHRPPRPVTSRYQPGWWKRAQARVTVPRTMARMEPLVQMAA
jgi:hypothetical protein